MYNPFKAIEKIEAERFTSLPAEFRVKTSNEWTEHNRQGTPVEAFLEGPSFDRAGNLLVVDIPFGRVFSISPSGQWRLVVQYDGWPNGLKMHKDGRAFIADYRTGLMVLDPATGKIGNALKTAYSEGFKGLNDLHFAPNGDLFFTDQGQTGVVDPTGRIFRLRADGTLDRLAGNAPSPNGISFNANAKQLFVAVTRTQQIWRLPLMADGQPSKTGVAIQLSGGAGPDGIEVDEEGGLVVAHPGVGVWRFDPHGLPTHFIGLPPGHMTTNIAFGGSDRRSLYITESIKNEVWVARMPVAGAVMYGLS